MSLIRQQSEKNAGRAAVRLSNAVGVSVYFEPSLYETNKWKVCACKDTAILGTAIYDGYAKKWIYTAAK